MWQLIKFTLFSASAGIIQAGSFALLNEFMDWSYWPSYLISLVLSILWNFTFNRRFTFKSANNIPVAMAKVFGFYLVFTPISLWLGEEATQAGTNEYIVLAVTMISNLILEFLFCKFVVYRTRRFGDRKDGTLIRKQDSMHFIMPIIYPNRCDNEAYVSEKIDYTRMREYIDKKNAQQPEFKYTMFHLIVAALIKTITLRPKLNRFIANKNTYQRNEVTAAFTVKKIFSDNGDEALAVLHAKDDSTLTSLHDQLYEQISGCRSDKVDASTGAMNIFNKMPRFFSKFIIWIVTKLDIHGWVPSSVIATDPYYCSVVLSNVGSIKLKSGYHHLTNWGTCSLFCLIGERKMSPFFDESGNVTMRETVELGLTIDERLADGYYYSKSIKLLKHLLENPELLELPANMPVDEAVTAI